MLTLSSVRLRWRESVSLGRFQNCNLLEMDNFRRRGVEDEPGKGGCVATDTIIGEHNLTQTNPCRETTP